MKFVEYGLYTVSDQYFERFKDYGSFYQNKEERRPHFLALRDGDGIIWMIPLSSQIDTYAPKIDAAAKKFGECLYYHIGTLAKKERVFMISGMFPLTERYISKAFTIAGTHYIVREKVLIRKLTSKAKRFLKLVELGRVHPSIQVAKIKSILLQD